MKNSLFVVSWMITCLLLRPQALSQQQTGFIEGRVVDAGSGKPLFGAKLFLGNRDSRERQLTVSTDASGRFALRSVPVGIYDLWAAFTGYRDGGYLQSSALGAATSVEIQPGTVIREVTVRLWRHSTVGGRVVDDQGDPVIGVKVMALQLSWQFHQPRLIQTVVPVVQTDDQGRYRLLGVPQGRYVIAVEGSDTQHDSAVRAASLDYVTTYYPGTTRADAASAISVGASEEVTGIDLRMPPVVSRAASIQVEIAGGPEGVAWTVELVPSADTIASDLDVRRSAAVSNGVCVFDGVSIGVYAVRAVAFAEPSNIIPYGRNRIYIPHPPDPHRTIEMRPTYWAEESVNVTEPGVRKLRLQVQKADQVRGLIEFQGTSPRPDDLTMLMRQVFVIPANGRLFHGISSSRLDLSGQFVTVGLPPGAYTLETPLFAGWTLKSVTIDGRPSEDGIIELRNQSVSAKYVFTDRPGEISGMVRDEQRRPIFRATVFAFPKNRDLWRAFSLPPLRARRARPTADGRYRLAGLPSGEYYVTAVSGDVPDQWQTPEYLASLVPGALTVRSDGSSAQQISLDIKR